MRKFSKSSKGLLKSKQAYFTANKTLIESEQSLFRLYQSQPMRLNCKNCDQRLGPPSFSKSGVSYILCDICEHLNGRHEDTLEFCSHVYSDDGGSSYATAYVAPSREAYDERLKEIYLPKDEFLIQSLIEVKESPGDHSYVDVGAGCGYVLSALKELNIQKMRGYEVSSSQADFGNTMLELNLIHRQSIEETKNIVAEIDAEV